MSVEVIFGLQFVLSVLVVAMIARWYVAPWLAKFSLYSALAILLLPHTFRHVGMSFLVPGLVGDNIPQDFAYAAAYGDLASGLIALAAIFLLRRKSIAAIPVVWFFNILGTVDLVNALRQATVIPELGVTWYIPTFIVPVLLVTHMMIFAQLIRRTSTTTIKDHVNSQQEKVTDTGRS